MVQTMIDPKVVNLLPSRKTRRSKLAKLVSLAFDPIVNFHYFKLPLNKG